MPFIKKNEVKESALAISCIELATMLDTYPVQIVRWHKDGLLKQYDGRFYEPMQAITAIVNWAGRGRIPKPVLEWRQMLGEKSNRAAFLDGMACAFNLVAKTMERQRHHELKCSYFLKEDPAYQV